MSMTTPGTVPDWLVFGLSGQVGEAFAGALAASDPPCVAPSRQPRPPRPGVRWVLAGLGDFTAPGGRVAAIASLGPLDAFVDWLARSPVAPARVVVLGSTSVHGKRDSPDAAERALALALRTAELRLAALAAERGFALTVLRPTLIYGNGRDRSLSRLVAVARRWRVLPLPATARGLRQPVHVEDVATAVLACLREPRPRPGFFDLPGGEALPFDQMVVRALAAGAPGARRLRVPAPLFRLAVRGLRLLGRAPGLGEGFLARLDQDLVYDGAPARAALGHSPRGFRPGAEAFPARVAAQHQEP
ncbi:MAG TPA: NAD-dependent epimerase/dehydratase family protein [Arenimonas sp.]|uniref:NAD-dependent epimerase/dehydratase family protein n=1 Tax=Arenimonas sp. TaxID=1872635 RepID=UPI002D7F7D6F|nr:NAD-dependent epimerase/dehydratase family protein [Arenimonas sp.]HEU0152275.1 NAD-dependent epimerase/dehydratase family protein [Arenimonas sp.]